MCTGYPAVRVYPMIMRSRRQDALWADIGGWLSMPRAFQSSVNSVVAGGSLSLSLTYIRILFPTIFIFFDIPTRTSYKFNKHKALTTQQRARL